MAAAEDALAVHQFWFSEIKSDQWWRKDREFDDQIRNRFTGLHRRAARGELFAWRTTDKGRLAEIIVLDQFSRNIYRDGPASFANDAQALVLSQTAVECGADQKLNAAEKAFLYMPFMHSESLLVHATAVRLFAQPGLNDFYNFELKHKAVIERFGRYPHRNAILGRVSTPAELEYLQQDGSGF